MNALSIPTLGIKDVTRLEQELSKGVVPLAKYLCPDQWIEEATLPVIQQTCLWALIEQLKLRDEYIQKCLKDLGIDIPEPQHEVTWIEVQTTDEPVIGTPSKCTKCNRYLCACKI